MKTARFGAFIKYLEITALRITKKTDKRFKTGMAWSQAEVELLIKLYPISYNTDLAIRFNRSQEAIRGKARKLGLAKDYAGGYQRLWGIGQPWSGTEINLLRELYATYTPNEEIAKKIGRTYHAIQKMAEKLGLVKMEFWSESEDELIKKFNRAKAELLTEELELEKLKSACKPNRAAAINSTVDKVAESMRSQISCALDFAYS